MIWRRWFALLVVLIFVLPVSAQDDSTNTRVITAGNITRLRSVATVEFTTLPDDMGEFETGWFETNTSGDAFLITNKQGDLIHFDLRNTDVYVLRPAVLTADDLPASIVDVDFESGDLIWSFAALYADSTGPRIDHEYAQGDALFDRIIPYETPDLPQSIWSTQYDVWVELLAASDGQPYILHLPSPFEDGILAANADETEIIPYGPATDPDALVRIGRIEPPFVVTSSAEGLVKRWNLQTGKVTASAQVVDGPAVFGQINASGSHLAWRDPQDRLLHLLNFETGEDRVVAELDNQYAQYFFLSNEADVIIAVNIAFEPVVVAWDVATGQRYDLGPYRACSRIPDMARLSKDGTTLVIGCDTGLDIWRVS